MTTNIWTRILAATEVVAAARALVVAKRALRKMPLSPLREMAVAQLDEHHDRLDRAVAAYDATEAA